MLSESDWEKVNQEGDLSLSNSILTRSKSRQMQDFAVNKIDKASTSAETVYVVPRVTRTFLDFDYGKNEEEDEDYDPEKDNVTMDIDKLNSLLSEESDLPCHHTRSRLHNMNDENIDYDFDYSPLLLSEIDNPDYIEFITSLNDPTKYEDDESEDPEYIVSEDNDFINCVDNDEIRMDKETEITRREMRVLFEDLAEANLLPPSISNVPNNASTPCKNRGGKKEQINFEMIKNKKLKMDPLVHEVNSVFYVGCCPNQSGILPESSSLVGVSVENPPIFSSDELRQLAAQLTKHVQLLTQFVVCCADEPNLTTTYNAFQLMINELYENYCDRPQYSLFNISNLIASVETCHDARNSHIIDLPELDQFVHNNVLAPKPKAMVVLARSHALLYPELLSLARPFSFDNKPYRHFIPPEESLLALAHNQFSHVPHSNNSNLHGRNPLISRHLLPTKDVAQIRNHMKRVRHSKEPVHLLIKRAESEAVTMIFPIDNQSTAQFGPPYTWETTFHPIWLKVLLQRINFLAVPLNLEDIQNGNVDGTVQTISDTVISKLDNCTVLQGEQQNENPDKLPSTNQCEEHSNVPIKLISISDDDYEGSHSNGSNATIKTPNFNASFMSNVSNPSPVSQIDEDTNAEWRRDDYIPPTPQIYDEDRTRDSFGATIPNPSRQKNQIGGNFLFDRSYIGVQNNASEDLLGKHFENDENIAEEEAQTDYDNERNDERIREEKNVRKRGRRERFADGISGLFDREHRERQIKALSRVILGDFKQVMFMHQDKVRAIQKLVAESAASAQMFEKLADILGPEHEALLVHLSFIFPQDLLPDYIIDSPLRKAYKAAFDMMLNIEAYTNFGRSKCSARSIFRNIRELGSLCSADDLQILLEKLLISETPLLEALSTYLPGATDRTIPKPVEYEFLDAEQWKDTDAAYESIDAIPGTLQDKHKRRAATVISDGTLLVEKQGKLWEIKTQLSKNDFSLKQTDYEIFNPPRLITTSKRMRKASKRKREEDFLTDNIETKGEVEIIASISSDKTVGEKDVSRPENKPEKDIRRMQSTNEIESKNDNISIQESNKKTVIWKNEDFKILKPTMKCDLIKIIREANIISEQKNFELKRIHCDDNTVQLAINLNLRVCMDDNMKNEQPQVTSICSDMHLPPKKRRFPNMQNNQKSSLFLAQPQTFDILYENCEKSATGRAQHDSGPIFPKFQPANLKDATVVSEVLTAQECVLITGIDQSMQNGSKWKFSPRNTGDTTSITEHKWSKEEDRMILTAYNDFDGIEQSIIRSVTPLIKGVIENDVRNRLHFLLNFFDSMYKS